MITNTPSPLSEADRSNFDALMLAAKNKHLCLVSSIDKSTNTPRALVCILKKCEDGNLALTPIAVMIWSDPYEMFIEPTN